MVTGKAMGLFFEEKYANTDDHNPRIVKGYMFFKKQKKDTDIIVRDLALLRMNRHGKSMLLENEHIETEAVTQFVKQCGISFHRFRLAEDILRFAIVYNALSVHLDLKDKKLEEEILNKLREAHVFLKTWGLDQASQRKRIEGDLAFVETGFTLLMDNLAISKRELKIGANEMLATRFIHFISNGNLGMEDDKPAWLAIAFAIYQDLDRLPEDISKAKRKLGLK